MIKDEYDAIYSMQRTHWWYRARRDIVLAMIDKAISEMAEKPSIIDFGCGCGSMLCDLSLRGDTTGIDISEYALSYSRTIFDGKLIAGDIQENTTDAIKCNIGVSLDLIEHLANDEKALSNIYDMLTTGGRLFLTVPAFSWLWSKHDEYAMHHRRYRVKELKKVLESVGFSIDYISYYNFRLAIPIALIKKISALLGSDFDDKAGNKNRDSTTNAFLYRVFAGEKRRILKGLPYPFGISIIAQCRK